MTAEPAQRMWGVIEPYLAAEGIELDDLEIVGGSDASLVRVVVDAPEPVDVDTLARLSRGVSRLLDDDAEGGPVAGSYTLEVTSPGLERTLRRRRHFEKAVGREVRVKTKRPVEGSNHLRGLLAAVGADELTMETDGGQVTVPFDEVATARTVFVWEAAPKPGGRR